MLYLSRHNQIVVSVLICKEKDNDHVGGPEQVRSIFQSVKSITRLSNETHHVWRDECSVNQIPRENSVRKDQNIKLYRPIMTSQKLLKTSSGKIIHFIDAYFTSSLYLTSNPSLYSQIQFLSLLLMHTKKSISRSAVLLFVSVSSRFDDFALPPGVAFGTPSLMLSSFLVGCLLISVKEPFNSGDVT